MCVVPVGPVDADTASNANGTNCSSPPVLSTTLAAGPLDERAASQHSEPSGVDTGVATSSVLKWLIGWADEAGKPVVPDFARRSEFTPSPEPFGRLMLVHAAVLFGVISPCVWMGLRPVNASHEPIVCGVPPIVFAMPFSTSWVVSDPLVTTELLMAGGSATAELAKVPARAASPTQATPTVTKLFSFMYISLSWRDFGGIRPAPVERAVSHPGEIAAVPIPVFADRFPHSNSRDY